MNWLLVVFEILCIAYALWIMVCLGVYATLKDRIPEGAWHWKVYDSWYENPPWTNLKYLGKLILQPFLMILAICILLCFACCCFVIFFIFDWIIKPIAFGEYVVDWKDKDYWWGNTSRHIEDTALRPKPEYDKFLPFTPLPWFFGFVSMFILYYGVHSPYIKFEITGLSTEAFALSGTIALLLVIFHYKDSISRSWNNVAEKIKEKTCRPIQAPGEETD